QHKHHEHHVQAETQIARLGPCAHRQASDAHATTSACAFAQPDASRAEAGMCFAIRANGLSFMTVSSPSLPDQRLLTIISAGPGETMPRRPRAICSIRLFSAQVA